MKYNPPAFPIPEIRDPFGVGICEGSTGMTLRDWFAGQALPRCIAIVHHDPNLKGSSRPELYDVAASLSYSMADAMLVARGDS